MRYPLGIGDDSDPSKKAGEFETFPAGKHAVNGILRFTTQDEEGVPFYKLDNLGRQVVRVLLRLPDGKEGPPMSLTPSQAVLLVLAFGGPAAVAALPKDHNSVQFLLAVRKALTAEGLPEQTASVNDKGWCNFISGMNLPTDMMFRWKGPVFHSTDMHEEGVVFHADAHGKPMMYAFFSVMGDVSGNPTPYDGVSVRVYFYQPFDGTVTKADGTRTPKFANTSNGALSMAAQRMRRLLEIYWPEVADYRWQPDSEQSAYGVDEVAYPMVVIADRLSKSSAYAIGKVRKSTKSDNIILDPAELVPASGSAAPAAKATDFVAELRSLINDYVLAATGKSAFVAYPEPALSAEGKAWMKAKAMTMWDELKLPAAHRIGDLNAEQSEQLFNAMMAAFGWPKKAAASDESDSF